LWIVFEVCQLLVVKNFEERQAMIVPADKIEEKKRRCHCPFECQ
jgi:hypothetical protein